MDYWVEGIDIHELTMYSYMSLCIVYIFVNEDIFCLTDTKLHCRYKM